MKTRQHSADSMFSFLLLLMFGMFALLLAGMGASVYKNSAAHLEENYTSRTAVAYVEEKVRQHDQQNAIHLTDVDGIPALALTESIQDEDFVTYIYYYDGALRELFVRASAAPQAANGTVIVELTGFSMEDVSSSDEMLLKITACGKDGKELSVLIHPSCR